MGYFSRLAVELLEETTDREDRELIYLEDEEDRALTNQDLAALQQEEQYSIWNEEYRKQLEQAAGAKAENDAPKVYKKKRSE